jgi:hypothetical protein
MNPQILTKAQPALAPSLETMPLKWTVLPGAALPLRKALPCSGSRAGTKAVAAIAWSSYETSSSSSGSGSAGKLTV